MSDHSTAVMVIDDDELFRLELQRALERHNCVVAPFSDLRSARKALSDGPGPELVLADRWIRQRPFEKHLLGEIRWRHPRARVVIYTRKSELSEAEVHRLISLGAIRVLDRSEVADSPEKILREFGELHELSVALDALSQGQSHLFSSLVDTTMDVTVIDRAYYCWFAETRRPSLVSTELVGGLYWTLFYGQPAELGPPWGCGIRDVLHQEPPRPPAVRRTIFARLRDHQVRWLSVQTRAIPAADGNPIAGTEVISALTDSFVQGMEPADRLFGIARGLVHAGFGRVRIYERRTNTATLKLIAAASRTDAFESKDYFSSLRQLSLDFEKCPYATAAMKSASGVMISSWAKGDSPFKASLNLKLPYFLVPIRDEGETDLIGLLAADFVGWPEKPTEQSEAAMKFLARLDTLPWLRETYGREIGRVVVGRRSRESIVSRDVFARMQAALRARQRIGAASSLEDAIGALVEGFSLIAPDCFFSVRRIEGESLVVVRQLEVPSGVAQKDVVAKNDPDSLAAYVHTTHLRPLWIDDYVAHRKKGRSDAGPPGLSQSHMRSVAHIPLSFEDTVFGVLSVDSPNLHRWSAEGFTEPLISLAECTALVLRDFGMQAEREEAKRLSVAEGAIDDVADVLPLCVFVKGRDLRFRYANKRFCEDVSRTREEIVGLTDVDLFGADIGAKYQEADAEVIRSGITFEDDDETHPNAKGEAREVRVIKSPLRNSAGDIEGIVGVYWDVTVANRSFRQAQSWREVFLQGANAIVYAHDNQGMITFVNQTAAEYLGYRIEELTGMSLFTLVVPRHHAEVRKLLAVTTGDHKAAPMHGVRELSFLARDLREIQLEVAVSICEVETHKREILAVAHDVTERNEARARLAHELARVKALRSVAGGFGRADTPTHLYRLFLLAVTHGECLGFSRAILFLPLPGAKGCYQANLAVGQVSRATAQERWKEGKKVTFDAALELVLRSAGSSRPGDLQSEIANLAINLDAEKEVAIELNQGRAILRRLRQPSPIRSAQFAAITKPDRNEDVEFVLVPLRHQQRLQAILWADRAYLGDAVIDDAVVANVDILWAEATLMVDALENRAKTERVAQDIARGMSYSLQTRSGILEFELARLRWALGPKHAKAIKKMAGAIEFFKNASVLATKDHSLAEVGIGSLDRLELNRVVADVVGRLDFPKITQNLAATPISLEMNRTHLEDILIEVLTNALDFAISRVWIETTTMRHYAQLDIRDDGPGVHASIKPELFKRFKRYPEGRMGMGLAYVKSLATAYGGEIAEIGLPGGGAHFVVKLPLMGKNEHE